MAQLPVPGRSGPEPGLTDGAPFTIGGLPEEPRHVLTVLTEGGHEAVLVGGCLRDLLRGEAPGDWDVATSALPEQVSRLLPGSTWENRFGTVVLPGARPVEITTYRTESTYSDRRRPDEVRFHGSLLDDLARRDFTINAIAWLPEAAGSGDGRLIDPFDGVGDLRERRLRAVGEAADRFAEDALRVLRGVRFALRFDFQIDPATERALAGAVPLTAGLSAERVRDELLRLLADPLIEPSSALRRWEELRLLATLMPELGRLRGIPQAKPRGGDALDHALWTADALPADDPVLRMAGLLHDLGKADTLAGGHFIGHEVVGAKAAELVMRRLRFGARQVARVRHLVRQHMFGYEPSWTDAAVRRFVRRVGHRSLGDLFALRHADNAASGETEPAGGGLEELRRRIDAQQAAPVAHDHLAVDGHDLQAALGIGPGPQVGHLLHRLVEAVIDDPALNDRETLLHLAREALGER